jgi:hypothetical protein
MRIVEAFEITGRGLVVVVDEQTDAPAGQRLSATIVQPDGSSVSVAATKEWLLRRATHPPEREAFLLIGLSMSETLVGAELRLHL